MEAPEREVDSGVSQAYLRVNHATGKLSGEGPTMRMHAHFLMVSLLLVSAVPIAATPVPNPVYTAGSGPFGLGLEDFNRDGIRVSWSRTMDRAMAAGPATCRGATYFYYVSKHASGKNFYVEAVHADGSRAIFGPAHRD